MQLPVVLCNWLLAANAQLVRVTGKLLRVCDGHECEAIGDVCRDA